MICVKVYNRMVMLIHHYNYYNLKVTIISLGLPLNYLYPLTKLSQTNLMQEDMSNKAPWVFYKFKVKKIVCLLKF
jgi:hypothetical protein